MKIFTIASLEALNPTNVGDLQALRRTAAEQFAELVDELANDRDRDVGEKLGVLAEFIVAINRRIRRLVN